MQDLPHPAIRQLPHSVSSSGWQPCNQVEVEQGGFILGHSASQTPHPPHPQILGTISCLVRATPVLLTPGQKLAVATGPPSCQLLTGMYVLPVCVSSHICCLRQPRKAIPESRVVGSMIQVCSSPLQPFREKTSLAVVLLSSSLESHPTGTAISAFLSPPLSSRWPQHGLAAALPEIWLT